MFSGKNMRCYTAKTKANNNNNNNNNTYTYTYTYMVSGLNDVSSLDSEDDYRSGSRNVSHNNSLSKDYPHPDDHAKEITDTPGFKPFTKVKKVVQHKPVLSVPL